jgi:hypothetical protein
MSNQLHIERRINVKSWLAAGAVYRMSGSSIKKAL